jgi:hypothetical protein
MPDQSKESNQSGDYRVGKQIKLLAAFYCYIRYSPSTSSSSASTSPSICYLAAYLPMEQSKHGVGPAICNKKCMHAVAVRKDAPPDPPSSNGLGCHFLLLLPRYLTTIISSPYHR